MPNKKPKKPKQSEEADGEQVLVRRVDALMSARLAEEAGPPEPASSEKPEEPEKPIEDPPTDPLSDNDTDKAVDDIVAHESDTILAVNDALVARERDEAEPGQPAGPRVRHKWAWFVFLIILAGSAVDLYIFLSK